MIVLGIGMYAVGAVSKYVIDRNEQECREAEARRERMEKLGIYIQ